MHAHDFEAVQKEKSRAMIYPYRSGCNCAQRCKPPEPSETAYATSTVRGPRLALSDADDLAAHNPRKRKLHKASEEKGSEEECNFGMHGRRQSDAAEDDSTTCGHPCFKRRRSTLPLLLEAGENTSTMSG
jgi:hypothetical protein